MKKILLILVWLLIGLVGVSTAASFKGGLVCISEELWDQAVSAAMNNDEHAKKYLLKNGCFVAKRGIPAAVLATTWTGKVKIRAYVEGDAIILWTDNVYINRCVYSSPAGLCLRIA